ncbi:MAG: NAD(P)/FAD-dependent oxidoreductase [Gammaproteobacteria bacterium]|jgi:predicted Rossmann fold flavoprotein|nr:NAD(P)/FAD-dependent oxidoreductase [Gammaproteobacteria bacterium]
MLSEKTIGKSAIQDLDVIIIGAGAAGLLCGATAGQRGRRVLIVDHANKVGKKILLSGGGRCNFTHRMASPAQYLSDNPFFCISALKRYTPLDFENLVKKYQIAYHEKAPNQLFCDDSAKQILDLLLKECGLGCVEIKLQTPITRIQKTDSFIIETSQGIFRAPALVIACGGPSFPSMGASPFGYQIAEQFGLRVLPVRAALVPLTLHKPDLDRFAPLSGVSLDVIATCRGQSFKEAMLFTHRGLSGPAILQISSYWQPGDTLEINLLPDLDLPHILKENRLARPKTELKTILAGLLPSRLAQLLCEHMLPNKPINQFNEKEYIEMAHTLQHFKIKPNGTEGYRTAEVTLGGVDTDEISSKTFESKKIPGLYFIGEVLDVTGHLGGFNFQWAWSSGFCCGQFV